MVCCASCVCKRVFEVVSRQVVSVCVHCYRESSRIRQPPQAVADTTTIDQALRGKWWRPEELGIVDYSNQQSAASPLTTAASASGAGAVDSHGESSGEGASNSASAAAASTSTTRNSLYNEQDVLVRLDNVKPLVPGLLDGIDVAALSAAMQDTGVATVDAVAAYGDEDEDPANLSDTERLPTPPPRDSPLSSGAKTPPRGGAVAALSGGGAGGARVGVGGAGGGEQLPAKTARCKRCGLLISRNMEAIEAHMEECTGTPAAGDGAASGAGGGAGGGGVGGGDASYMLNGNDGSVTYTYGNSRVFAGITRNVQLEKKFGTRVIYRTSRHAQRTGVRPREVCAFQDSFVDPDGTCYVYEISIRHCDVMGLPDYVTADAMVIYLYCYEIFRGIFASLLEYEQYIYSIYIYIICEKLSFYCF